VSDQVFLAVVVGGGAGIGAAVVDSYRAQGRPVVVWDIDGERDVDCDVAVPAQVDAALATTLERFGSPTTATITAGIGHAGALIDLAPEEFDRVLGVNTKGVWLAMRALALPMIDAGAGSIVAISSISARVADRGMGMYCASKAALDMLVRVAALEWAPHRVRVNAVAPGVTETRMLGGAQTDGGWLAGVQKRTALGRLGAPADIAAAVLALHDLDWVTGQTLECDGGLALHSPIGPSR
jgi:NAD(P)-dependent dehydrogenase (short-subunit alcohol dehydrogenase family)